MISQEDFLHALTKVFPSVSKRDEQSYARLETSLRKTRSHINTEGNPTEKEDHPNVKKSVTPVRPGGGGNPSSVRKQH